MENMSSRLFADSGQEISGLGSTRIRGDSIAQKRSSGISTTASLGQRRPHRIPCIRALPQPFRIVYSAKLMLASFQYTINGAAAVERVGDALVMISNDGKGLQPGGNMRLAAIRQV